MQKNKESARINLSESSEFFPVEIHEKSIPNPTPVSMGILIPISECEIQKEIEGIINFVVRK